MNQPHETSEHNTPHTVDTKPEKRRFSDHLPVLYLLALALILLGQILGSFLELIPFMTNTDIGVTAYMYVQFIGIWFLTLLFLVFTKKNRPILQSIGPRTAGNNGKLFVLGLIIGFGLNGICILAAWLHKDIALYYKGFQPVYLILIFVAVFIQSSAEELICRGFLYQRLRKSYSSPAVAVIGNSLLFAILHLFNEGITVLSVINIFVVGILFSMMVFYLDSLWCAMAAHTAWNFMQNIIFGLPNSGIVLPYSVFGLDASTAENSFAYNVGFGIEGTLLADIVLILACIALYLWGRKHTSHASGQAHECV